MSLALALSLPGAFADRELLRVMNFGVMLFTISVQGTTMQFLIRRLGIGRHPEDELEYERRYGRLLTAQSALRRVSEMNREGLISTTTWKQLEPSLQNQVEDLLDSQRQLIQPIPNCNPKNSKTRGSKLCGRNARR